MQIVSQHRQMIRAGEFIGRTFGTFHRGAEWPQAGVICRAGRHDPRPAAAVEMAAPRLQFKLNDRIK